MTDDELRNRTRIALEANALSLCEYFVLCEAGYRVCVEPDEIVHQAAGCAEGDPRGSFTYAEYAAALARCLDRGLLQILTVDDFDSDGRPTYLQGLGLSFLGYAPGHVDFTEAGHSVFGAVNRAIHDDRDA